MPNASPTSSPATRFLRSGPGATCDRFTNDQVPHKAMEETARGPRRSSVCSPYGSKGAFMADSSRSAAGGNSSDSSQRDFVATRTSSGNETINSRHTGGGASYWGATPMARCSKTAASRKPRGVPCRSSRATGVRISCPTRPPHVPEAKRPILDSEFERAGRLLARSGAFRR